VTALAYLSSNLEVQAKAYKKPALAAIFLLNNVHYTLKYLRQPAVRALVGAAAVAQYEDNVAVHTDAYHARCAVVLCPAVAVACAWMMMMMCV
jgi:hypothetical protein